jgi:hypothetical protein
MEKEFIPYQQALVLKQLGFNEPCFGYYVSVEVPNPFLVITKISDTQGGYFTFAPLYQQAFRWFREKYNISANVQSIYADETYTNLKFIFWFANYEDDSDEEISYNTYEEAELACLIKLIEIVKDEKSKSNS